MYLLYRVSSLLHRGFAGLLNGLKPLVSNLVTDDFPGETIVRIMECGKPAHTVRSNTPELRALFAY